MGPVLENVCIEAESRLGIETARCKASQDNL